MNPSGNIADLINDPSLTEFQTGQWYGINCGKNIKKYADETNTPVFMVRCGPACHLCTQFLNDVLKNSKSFNAIAKTNAIFLYYSSDEFDESHIKLTKNDTINIGQYQNGYYMCQDMRTFAQKDKNGSINYYVEYSAPWPRIVGYHNLGDGTIIMSRGIIQESDLVIIENKSNNMYGSSSNDINYYLQWFNENYRTEQKQNTFSVTFYDYDNTLLKETQQVSVYMDAIPPEEPLRTNYQFIGWNPDYQKVTQNLSCYAQYQKMDVYNPITKNFCFGLNKNCTITTSDGCVFQYDYTSNQIYLKK